MIKEKDWIRMFFGASLIIFGMITYKAWISFPTPKDFYGSIFMNFGVVYPVAGIVAICAGTYLMLTSSED